MISNAPNDGAAAGLDGFSPSGKGAGSDWRGLLERLWAAAYGKFI